MVSWTHPEKAVSRLNSDALVTQLPSSSHLIFKTLVDDREDYPYLTTMSENTEQTNSIMLDLILRKYSRKYRKYLKLKKKNK